MNADDERLQFNSIGEQVKYYRKKRGMTLKELGSKLGLTAGYLSQLERGQTSATLISMQNIAKALDVPLNVFLEIPVSSNDFIIREYERKAYNIKQSEGSFFYSLKIGASQGLRMSPNIKVILPDDGEKKVSPYTHSDEELGYVLEGVLTLYVNGEKHELYPGDFFHFLSTTPHYLTNHTNKLVKILYVTRPLEG